MWKLTSWFCFCLVVSAVSLGCGPSGPPLARIEGTVTLDDEPLEGAAVEFMSLTPGGSGSFSIEKTDENGRFEMGYSVDRDGVLPGKYKVSISTFDQIMQENGRTKNIPERVPRKYNLETELEREVDEGKHDMLFDLRSK